MLGDLDAAIGGEAETDSGARVKVRMDNYKALLGSSYKEYKKAEWFGAAIDWQVDPHTIGTSEVKYNYSWKDDYIKSDWHGFQEAVKAHHADAFKVLAGIFKQMEIDVAC